MQTDGTPLAVWSPTHAPGSLVRLPKTGSVSGFKPLRLKDIPAAQTQNHAMLFGARTADDVDEAQRGALEGALAARLPGLRALQEVKLPLERLPQSLTLWYAFLACGTLQRVSIVFTDMSAMEDSLVTCLSRAPSVWQQLKVRSAMNK